MSITTKELKVLDDLIKNEQVLIKKLRFFADQTSDANMKTKYEQIAVRHQNHIDTLMQFMN